MWPPSRISTTTHQEPMGSRKFSSFLSTHATLQDIDSPSGISPLRFLCIGFRHVNVAADCFYTLNDAYRFRDLRIPCGLCSSLCTLRLHCSRFAVVETTLQRSAGHATLDTVGWLNLMKTILCLPDRVLHPARNDKLRLPHQRSN